MSNDTYKNSKRQVIRKHSNSKLYLAKHAYGRLVRDFQIFSFAKYRTKIAGAAMDKKFHLQAMKTISSDIQEYSEK